ncbi:hypothetical protein H6P81_009243 [Aristolochia fimbriata]|uniref:Uncharacterized protein n=1 Tax=Aristolochia fimbriata TaxID=158543 RepID=A0AAV7EKI3_ARIFI|nr:hypothetical protein H6P81_009243 [Aristolochia fimbriata]
MSAFLSIESQRRKKRKCQGKDVKIETVTAKKKKGRRKAEVHGQRGDGTKRPLRRLTGDERPDLQGFGRGSGGESGGSREGKSEGEWGGGGGGGVGRGSREFVLPPGPGQAGFDF